MTELYDLQANMLREAWTVTTKLDTFILKHWLDDVDKYQAEVMTNPRARVPEPIKLTSDVCFSTPMVSMGRRRVAGVKRLREVARGAPKGNRARINYIIELYESNEIANIKTAENIVERLTSKTARKIFTDKTDKLYNKLVEDATGRKIFDLASGKRKADVKPQNVMVTMILFREKEDDKKEKQRTKENRSAIPREIETPVNIDFPKGTTVAEANEEKAARVMGVL